MSAYPVALRLAGRRVVVVAGRRVAARRIPGCWAEAEVSNLLRAGRRRGGQQRVDAGGGSPLRALRAALYSAWP